MITKRKEDLEKMKFEYAQRMVAFAEDKLESLCRVEVDKARSCFVRASKGEKFPPKDPCEGFTPTGKGVTGTSVMVKRLNQVRDACFEQANQAGDKARYDHASAVKNIEQDIIEKQNQIKDLNTNINLEKQEFDAITKENETEKTNETASTDQKQGNLAEKLNKLKISTEEKLVASKKRIDELNLQIEELVARKMPGRLGIIPDSDGNDITVAHREAKKAVEGLENARNTAFDKCGCEAKLKANKNDPSCLKLKKSFSDKDGGGIGGKSRGTN